MVRVTAYLYDESQSAAVTNRWEVQILDEIATLATFHGHRRHYTASGTATGTQILNFGRFLIYYEVDEAAEVVNVLRVLGGEQEQPTTF